MKRIFLFSCCLAITLIGSTQTTFFNVFESSYFDQSFDVMETQNGDFIIVGERAISYLEDTTFRYCLKINKHGDFLNESTFGEPGIWTRYSFIQRNPESQTNYIVGGWEWKEIQDTIYNSIILTTINDELNIQTEATFTSPKNYVHRPIKGLIICDTLLLVLSQYYPPGLNSHIAVTKFTTALDSLATYESPTNLFSGPYDILFSENDSLIRVFYIGNLFKENSPSKILRLDLNLNYLCTIEGPQYIISAICSTPYSDTSYLLTGCGRSDPPTIKQHILTYLMDSNDDTLKLTEYFNDPDTILYAGWGENTVISGNSIFITGCYNFDPATYPWQITPTWIQITKLDMDLNIISHHFYGGDKLYIPFASIPVSDGGVLITGFTWNYNLQGNLLRNIFVLKVDTDGLITNIPEYSSWMLQDALLYPNPGSDYSFAIVSAQYPIATLYLYDVVGRPVFEYKINQPRTRVNTESLNTGTYIYRFIAGGKEIGSGKWVKQ